MLKASNFEEDIDVQENFLVNGVEPDDADKLVPDEGVTMLEDDAWAI